MTEDERLQHEEDMAACEERNLWGYQRDADTCVTRPRASVDLAPSSAITNSRFQVDQRTDNSKSSNPAIPWIIATGVCALSIGLALGVALMSHGQITAEGRAIKAELREEFEARLQNLDARMKVAEYEASVAKTNSQRTDEKLNARFK